MRSLSVAFDSLAKGFRHSDVQLQLSLPDCLRYGIRDEFHAAYLSALTLLKLGQLGHNMYT